MIRTHTTDPQPTRLSTDDRGVSEVLGTVLMFGLLLAVLVLVQATAVPVWNQQVEFTHNQRVQADVQELVRAVTTAGATDTDRTTVVELGTTYPSRPFLFNPSDPAGTLSASPRQVTLENARLVGVSNHWTTDPAPFETAAVVYEPGYRQYGTAPATVYEAGVVYNRFDDARVVLSAPAVVDGRSVDLVLVESDLSVARTGSTTVRAVPISAPAQAVPVRAPGSESVNVTVETGLSADAWRALLADEIDGPGVQAENERYVDSVTCLAGGPDDRPCDGDLRITLEAGATYDVRIAKVGVGGASTTGSAAYVTGVAGGEDTLLLGGTTELVFEVRDAYNNPVTGVPVAFSTTGGSLAATAGESDESGRVAATFTGTDVGTHTVTAEVTTPSGVSTVSTDVEVVDADPGVGGRINPGETVDVRLMSAASTPGENNGVRMTFTSLSGSRTVESARINFFFAPNRNDQQVPDNASINVNPSQSTPPVDELVVGGPFASLAQDVTVSTGGTAVDLYFYDKEVNGAGVASYDSVGFGQSEFVVLSFRFEDGTEGTYFVAFDA